LPAIARQPSSPLHRQSDIIFFAANGIVAVSDQSIVIVYLPVMKSLPAPHQLNHRSLPPGMAGIAASAVFLNPASH
jgi:hypothetical protein